MNPVIQNIYGDFFEQYPYFKKVVAVDVECTDLSNNARILEIGACGFEYDGIDINYIEFQSMVNPHIPISQKTIELTGIRDEDVVNAPEDEDVFPAFDKWLTGSKVITMHNAPFDTRILRHNFHRIGMDFNQYEPNIRCTLQLSKAARLPISSMKLSDVATYFQYKNEQAHRALQDALTTLYIYARLTLPVR